mmetsp:Transcript_30612/g.71765  ORF Transcript_30612/g.71765 Transcript_30612/m.71765 type:complete len:229 (-) Transcript_30612:1270-1956(-)
MAPLAKNPSEVSSLSSSSSSSSASPLHIFCSASDRFEITLGPSSLDALSVACCFYQQTRLHWRQSRTRQSVTRHQKNLTYIKEGNRNGAEQQSILMVPSHLQQSGQQQLTLENVLLIKNVFRHILVCGKGIRIAEAHRGGRGILSTLDRARGIQQTQHIAFAHHLAQGFRPRVQGTINFGTGMVRCGAAKALQKGFIQYLGGGKGQGCAVVWKFATRIDEPVDNIVIR